MKKLFVLFLAAFILLKMAGQTPLTEAIDFHVKTPEGTTIKLFPLLDVEQKIVVIDFFSTTCGPCQEYADDFQAAYEAFGSNENNVFFVAINYGDDNAGVVAFDSTYGVTLPTVSGLQGGGDDVYIDYEIQAYPTVIIITPDHQIVEQFVWPPTQENIIDAVYNAGGIVVGVPQRALNNNKAVVFPNPIHKNGFFKINLDREAKLRLDIYNLVGNKLTETGISQLNIGGNSIELNVRDLENGFYFLRYQIDNQPWETVRFVVSH